MSARVGLARALSKLGVCSRSEARGLIARGRVRVNGVLRRDPELRIDMDRDRVTVDGAPAALPERIYLMLNKPRGLVTTRSDERGRATVYHCLEGADLPHLVPVGRLDRASEGLLLLTNDTRWAARILDPRSHLDKTYHVQLHRHPEEEELRRMAHGVTAPDGEVLRVKRAAVLRAGERTAWLEVVLDEGKNRQIRRVLQGLDLEVRRLVRVAVGPLRLGELPKGAFRALATEERSALDRALDGGGA